MTEQLKAAHGELRGWATGQGGVATWAVAKKANHLDFTISQFLNVSNQDH